MVTAFRKKYYNLVNGFRSRSGNRTKIIFAVEMASRALWFFPLLTLVLVIMPVIIVILELLRPWVFIRFGELRSDRIGEIVLRADLFFRRQFFQTNRTAHVNILYCGEVANHQVLTLIRRRLPIISAPLLYKFLVLGNTCFPSSRVWLGYLPGSSTAYREFNEAPVMLSWTAPENEMGCALLRQMGVPSDNSFVCIHGRDSTYLTQAVTHFSTVSADYHNHRDFNIHTYLPAAEYLTLLNYYVIRMGHLVAQPLRTTNPLIIDYATKYRVDFMDVFLPAHCKFFLGNSSGLFTVAHAFDIPVAAANWIPLRVPLWRKADILIPKKFWNIHKKRFLTFGESIRLEPKFNSVAGEFGAHGIEVIDNTPEEVLGLAREMNARIDRTWISNDDDEELQERFRRLYSPQQIAIGFPSRIGAEFLRQNKDLVC